MHLLQAIMVGVLGSFSLSAWACSDLPNICEMNAQHHQQMQDYGREAAEAYYSQQQEQYEAQASYTDYSSDDPMQTRLQVATGMLDLTAQKNQQAATLTQDPRYDRYINGGWDFFQDNQNPKKGEYCAAFFWKKESLIKVSGPGGEYQGAILTFWGENIPQPKKTETIQVTLKQSTGEAQTVRVFNYKLPNYQYAAISFAIPSAQALFDNMLEKEHFIIEKDGKKIVEAEWQDGLKARDQLKNCATGNKI